MRLVIDLDGVVCTLKKDNESYSEVKPLPEAVEKLKKLKAQGHYIILSTSRHMLTTNSNQGLVNKKIAKITFDWLEENKIPYDEIYFGKPYGEVYIDDSALTFTNWNELDIDGLDKDTLNIVIPMAGLGKRFLDAGYKTIKPLISIKGKPLFNLATESLEFLKTQGYKIRLIFVILKEHDDKFKLGETIKRTHPESQVLVIDNLTEGQAETVLKAKKYINNFNRLIIYPNDTLSENSHLKEIIENAKVDGAIASFEIDFKDERYSFVKSDQNNNVIEVAEKKQISNSISTGLYYFKKGSDFVSAAEEMIRKDIRIKGEFYVIPVYQILLERGKRIKNYSCERLDILGTPEELQSFLDK